MTKELQKNNHERSRDALSEDESFGTFDLGCATALTTANFLLLTLDRKNPRKVRFIFRRDAEIEEVADDFWNDRLEQKSRSYWDNLKTLKNRLYSNE